MVERYDGEARPHANDLALLGEAISEWSEVEFWLEVIFRRLAGLEFDASLALFNQIRNSRTIAGTLQELAAQKMEGEDARAFKGLLARFTKLAKRRNGIIHAYWYKDQKTREWCRYLVPSSKDKIKKVLGEKPKDQKLRTRHLFRQRDMRKFCADAQNLKSDIMEFWDVWDNQEV